jgi:hypothetical protein
VKWQSKLHSSILTPVFSSFDWMLLNFQFLWCHRNTPTPWNIFLIPFFDSPYLRLFWNCLSCTYNIPIYKPTLFNSLFPSLSNMLLIVETVLCLSYYYGMFRFCIQYLLPTASHITWCPTFCYGFSLLNISYTSISTGIHCTKIIFEIIVLSYWVIFWLNLCGKCGEFLRMSQVKSTRNRRACMRNLMTVEEAKGVCKDRSKWKEGISAYPKGKRAWCILCM